ncbi:DUF4907 domain-containing protein [Leeuwenhoekiella parthenopeia]|uniref:DUF4907 domain-containing protein n=1 Tax=Leeuwenhoekiella parthenopeia TaxID=2890320 RepID=A0ABS8GV77_9FLAO|nr:DUF4907 domain-containing protein [Leeuwenhoekiella parthenopeia]MCC4213097.1 DUF4907 domain-containing protein [Leeuwenhoekiella parthenopeia]
MNYKGTILYLGISLNVILLVIAIWLVYREDKVYTHVFETEQGYGYAIVDHGHILIKQAFIPAVTKERAFCTKQDAEKTARLVLKKLNDHQNPAVSEPELKALGIDLDCQK